MGRTVAQYVASGDIDVVQSAVSASWTALEQGRQPPLVHFAQINQRDGFLIAARGAGTDFQWDKLLAGRFMFVHGGQPEAMLAYAMHLRGVDLSEAKGLNGGDTGQMLSAFRAGQGDWFHEQAPYPQQLEYEGMAQVVASVGEVIGPVAFSSVAASSEWLERPEAKRFMRAYRKARAWVNSATPAEIAAAEQSMFPGIHRTALTRAIEYYQRLGTWSGACRSPRTRTRPHSTCSATPSSSRGAIPTTRWWSRHPTPKRIRSRLAVTSPGAPDSVPLVRCEHLCHAAG